jgi:hypothetical protein
MISRHNTDSQFCMGFGNLPVFVTNSSRLFTFTLQAQFRDPFSAKTYRLHSQVICGRETNAIDNVSLATVTAISRKLSVTADNYIKFQYA